MGYLFTLRFVLRQSQLYRSKSPGTLYVDQAGIKLKEICLPFVCINHINALFELYETKFSFLFFWRPGLRPRLALLRMTLNFGSSCLFHSAGIPRVHYCTGVIRSWRANPGPCESWISNLPKLPRVFNFEDI